MTDNNTISIDYSDKKLRILVEEYIIQQNRTFSLKGVCSYVLYWAMEDGHTIGTGLYESNQLAQFDCERISGVLEKIESEESIKYNGDNSYLKINNQK